MSIRLCQSCAPPRTMIETAQAPNELLGVRFSTVPRVWSRLPVARPQEPVTRPQLPSPWGRLNAAPHPDFLLVLPLDESGACFAPCPLPASLVSPLTRAHLLTLVRLHHASSATVQQFDLPPVRARPAVAVPVSAVALADVPVWVTPELRSSCVVSSCACGEWRGCELRSRPVAVPSHSCDPSIDGPCCYGVHRRSHTRAQDANSGVSARTSLGPDCGG